MPLAEEVAFESPICRNASQVGEQFHDTRHTAEQRAWNVTAASIRAITIGLLSMIVSFLFWADRAFTREILFAVFDQRLPAAVLLLGSGYRKAFG